MKRNVTTIVEINDEAIALRAVERLNGALVEIFSEQASITNRDAFLSNALRKIEQKVNGSIRYIEVVVNPSSSLRAKTVRTVKQIAISEVKVTRQQVLELEHALRYEAEMEASKHRLQVTQSFIYEYRIANANGAWVEIVDPVGASAKLLEATAAVTVIPRSIYQFVESFASKHGLLVGNIWLLPQTISRSCLEASALKGYQMVLNVSNHNTLVTLNKNGTTIDFETSPVGTDSLVKNVIQEFKCSKQAAEDIIDTFTYDLTPSKGKDESVTASRLRRLFDSFANEIFRFIGKFAHENAINDGYDLTVVGKIFSDKNAMLAARKLPLVRGVNNHHPTSFFEMNGGTSVVGLIALKDGVDRNGITSVINTNPKTLTSHKTTYGAKDTTITKKIKHYLLKTLSKFKKGN